MDLHEKYWKFVESERHFNTIQAGIRTRASTWLLAAFGAIAVLLKTGSTESYTLYFSTPVLVGIVSLLGAMGLLVLWINDQVVYQRLLNSVFLIGLKREYDNRRLPPVRMMMMCSAEGKGMSRWMTYYYTIPMACFMTVTLFVTFLQYKTPGKGGGLLEPAQSLWVLLAFSAAQIVVTLWVQLKKTVVTPKERAKLFENKGFEDMFTGDQKEVIEKLGKRIALYKPDDEDQQQQA